MLLRESPARLRLFFDMQTASSEQGLIDFLLQPESYPESPSRIVHYQTHISRVFVGDKRAYKIKKPVNFGFLDFTTLAKRYFYCKEEVLLNSRLADDTYLGVIPIYRKGEHYSFRPLKDSVVAEYAVKMKRIPEDKVLNNLIEEGELLHDRLVRTGEIIARFHLNAPIYKSGPYGGVGTVRTNTEENFEQIAPYRDVIIDEASYARLASYTRDFIRDNHECFAARKKRGFVREVHGDLHSKHICLTKPPIIFDCIEFNKRFRISDVLEDIAFLLMDLEYQGRFDLARAVSHAYFSSFPDAASPDVLRFYKIYRAVVRGKIEGFTADALQHDEEGRRAAVRRAKDYYGLARHYVDDHGDIFNPVVFMGVSGSGKSAIANGLFPDEGVVIRSDEIRKEIAGLSVNRHVYVDYGEDIYGPGMTETTYRIITERAVSLAKKGKRVVADATFLTSLHRLRFFEDCLRETLNPFFVYCLADEETLRERVLQRMKDNTDISDGHIAVLERQLQTMEEPRELPSFRVMKVNTRDKPEIIRGVLKSFL
ncbi:MAG: hypothetical protein A4E57_01055 [Syntrophorhabdaceae bacterium PtaU1.Bin034]|nr:MAG: hypothetical protein A4E57_01055 [Syntrophorhabdaceae bacterium PtaU1.Bin034]